MSNNGNYHAFEEDIDLNKISKRLWEIVEEAHPSTSLFDSKDFDPIQYINERFPDEDSLKNIESEVAKIKELISNSEKELEEHIYSQTNEGKHAFVAIEQAEQSIRKVIDDVENINAVVSERNHKINEITEDVRVLSLAKQNIESSLHMMSQLEAFLQSTQDLENRLAIKDVTADIKTELERLDRIEKRCQSFAEHLFRDLFLSETKSNIVNTNEIYKLISILKIQQSSVSWYVDRLIDQYTTTLTQNKEVCILAL
ncbi:hypothetical protein GJ496_011325 [Pomphorhynchus laevis]|nr:hypothetical protein GJ496_011325 [Pomphorhynchus laevis]